MQLLILWAPVWRRSALEVDLRAAEVLRQTLRFEEWSGATGVGMEEMQEFLLERFVFAGFGVGGLEFLQGGHEGFGDIASAVGTEAAFGLLCGSGGGWHGVCPYYAGFSEPCGLQSRLWREVRRSAAGSSDVGVYRGLTLHS